MMTRTPKLENHPSTNASFPVSSPSSVVYVKRLALTSLEFVIVLEATDDFLHRRVMNIPEKVVAGTHNAEVEFQRRLKAYHDLGDEGRAEKFFEDVDRPGETISEASRS